MTYPTYLALLNNIREKQTTQSDVGLDIGGYTGPFNTDPGFPIISYIEFDNVEPYRGVQYLYGDNWRSKNSGNGTYVTYSLNSTYNTISAKTNSAIILGDINFSRLPEFTLLYTFHSKELHVSSGNTLIISDSIYGFDQIKLSSENNLIIDIGGTEITSLGTIGLDALIHLVIKRRVDGTNFIFTVYINGLIVDMDSNSVVIPTVIVGAESNTFINTSKRYVKLYLLCAKELSEQEIQQLPYYDIPDLANNTLPYYSTPIVPPFTLTDTIASAVLSRDIITVPDHIYYQNLLSIGNVYAHFYLNDSNYIVHDTLEQIGFSTELPGIGVDLSLKHTNINACLPCSPTQRCVHLLGFDHTIDSSVRYTSSSSSAGLFLNAAGAANPASDVFMDGEFSISFWLKIEDWPNTSSVILSNNILQVQLLNAISPQINNNSLSIIFNRIYENTSGSAQYVYSVHSDSYLGEPFPNTLNTDVNWWDIYSTYSLFNHIVITYNRTTYTLKIYLNKNLVSTTDVTDVFDPNLVSLTYGNDGKFMFSGTTIGNNSDICIDELTFFNKELTPADILLMYNSINIPI